MTLLISLLAISSWIVVGTSDNTGPGPLDNSTDANKDMYVIHAMVYQVGILTNKTVDENIYANSTGNQEALTLYHTNGSNIDLSNIPTPLLTNITAQRFVGVAPTFDSGNVSADKSSLSWTALDHLASLQTVDGGGDFNKKRKYHIDGMEGSSLVYFFLKNQETRHPRQATTDTQVHQENYNETDNFRSKNRLPVIERLFKTSLTMKRDVVKQDQTPVKIVKGSASIPEGAGVQSIGIPPLFTLNANLSEIPVPIPNTSIVHYSKINTFVHAP